jgi:hypothetical protein
MQFTIKTRTFFAIAMLTVAVLTCTTPAHANSAACLKDSDPVLIAVQAGSDVLAEPAAGAFAMWTIKDGAIVGIRTATTRPHFVHEITLNHGQKWFYDGIGTKAPAGAPTVVWKSAVTFHTFQEEPAAALCAVR